MNDYLIFGASSAIATAYIHAVNKTDADARIVTISRSEVLKCSDLHFTSDYSLDSLTNIMEALRLKNVIPKKILIFNGLLHTSNKMPEKKVTDFDEQYITTLWNANTLIPWKCLLTSKVLISKRHRCDIVALSARIGSITDNKLGGWYSYRTSKAALNMLFKTAAIEFSREYKQCHFWLFHPGTTDSDLSRPYQRNAKKVFTANFVADQLIKILADPSKAANIGHCAYIDWQGDTIPW